MLHNAGGTIVVALVAAWVAAGTAQAAIHTETVPYTYGGVTYNGYLAYDDALKGPLPGVLVFHEWWGLNDYAKMRARKVAELGYVAFAADMYGGGVTTTNPDEAGKLSGALRDKPEGREIAKAALGVLAKNPLVDAKRIAAIGYCFGGSVALELAYSGADLAGVVTFHAGLTTPKPDEMKSVKARFLICHGANDTFESPEDIAKFQEAMRTGGYDWQMIYFGGAVHSFTNPDADKFGMKGIAYNKLADERSWEYMKIFLAGVFAK